MGPTTIQILLVFRDNKNTHGIPNRFKLPKAAKLPTTNIDSQRISWHDIPTSRSWPSTSCSKLAACEHPPPQKKKARPGGSTHTQTNKSFDQACHVWVTGQKSELHKKCYISAHARLTSTGTENLKDIRSSSSRKPSETYGDWTIYTVPPLSTKTRPSKWKLFPLAKKGENKTYSKHYDLYIGAC